MPVTHQPAGSAKGGQFAPGGGSSSSQSQSKGKKPPKPPGVKPLSPKAAAYLRSVASAEAWLKNPGGLPKLTGTKKQQAAQRKYYIALARSLKSKIKKNRATVKKATASQKVRTAKQKVLLAKAAALKSKQQAANIALRQKVSHTNG